MAQPSDKDGKRRSRVRYQTNPSVTAESIRSVNRPHRVGADIHNFYYADKARNLVEPGIAVFHRIKKVDNESFVKMYAAGINRQKELAKTGLAALEIVLRVVRQRENKDKDQIVLAYDLLSDEERKKMSKRTFFRGLNELIDNKLIYPCVVNNIYFIDITCMFNGDRFQVIDEYRRVDPQGDLFRDKDEPLQDQIDEREAA